jgi:hypothetical protein
VKYAYVGPSWILPSVSDRAPAAERSALVRQIELLGWDEPLSFVICDPGELILGPRQTEHVRLAGGDAVLAAGEIQFTRTATALEVVYVSNQSTGFCPSPECWSAVADALNRLGVVHNNEFAAAFEFRICRHCGAINLIKDAVFVCELCSSELPL